MGNGRCNHVERWKCDMAGHEGGGVCSACGAEWDCPECDDHDRMARDQMRDAELSTLRSERDELRARLESLGREHAKVVVRAIVAERSVPVAEAASAWVRMRRRTQQGGLLARHKYLSVVGALIAAVQRAEEAQKEAP